MGQVTTTLERIVSVARNSVAEQKTPIGIGPFEAIKLQGKYRTCLFAGGACLIVFDGHASLNAEWDAYLDRIELDVVKITLRALFDVGKAFGRTVTFYPDGQDRRSFS